MKMLYSYRIEGDLLLHILVFFLDLLLHILLAHLQSTI